MYLALYWGGTGVSAGLQYDISKQLSDVLQKGQMTVT